MDSEKNGLREFFTAYQQDFSRLDAHAMARKFAVPFMAFYQGDLAVWNNEAELFGALQAILAWYRDNGFVRARCRLEEVLFGGQEFATANVSWSLQRADQAPWSYGMCYHLHRVNGKWLIYGIAQFDRLQTVELPRESIRAV